MEKSWSPKFTYRSPSVCFHVGGHAIINNKSEEEGHRELCIECVMNFSVPHGAVSVVSAEVQRKGYFNSEEANYWLLLSSLELRKKAGV